MLEGLVGVTETKEIVRDESKEADEVDEDEFEVTALAAPPNGFLQLVRVRAMSEIRVSKENLTLTVSANVQLVTNMLSYP